MASFEQFRRIHWLALQQRASMKMATLKTVSTLTFSIEYLSTLLEDSESTNYNTGGHVALCPVLRNNSVRSSSRGYRSCTLPCYHVPSVVLALSFLLGGFEFLPLTSLLPLSSSMERYSFSSTKHGISKMNRCRTVIYDTIM